MQLIRAKVMIILENKTFPERKEKENLSLFIALRKKCFFLCILKLLSNQLLMKKKHLTEGQRYEIFAYLLSGVSQKEIRRFK